MATQILQLKTETYNIYVKMHTQAIFRFGLKILDDKDASKDVVQETFLKLWEHKERIDPLKVKSWLFTTSYRFCLHYLKKIKRNVSPDILENMVSPNTDYTDIKNVINESLLLLTDVQKSVVLLKDYEGFKYKEIGEILKISEDSVKVHLFRGRQKIKNYIKDIRAVI